MSGVHSTAIIQYGNVRYSITVVRQEEVGIPVFVPATSSISNNTLTPASILGKRNYSEMFSEASSKIPRYEVMSELYPEFGHNFK
jgi:hypothetical protein